MTPPDAALSWVEVDAPALSDNVAGFRRLVGPDVLLAPTVKANAYGHGTLLAARAFLAGGADWLCVNSLDEARVLREAGVSCPIHLIGPLPPARAAAAQAVALDCSVVVHDAATLDALAGAADPARPTRIHLKVETGTHRLGMPPADALAVARRAAATPGIELEGACSHFADVEDTTDHRFARSQREVFEAFLGEAAAAGITFRLRHFSNSAAALLWPEVWYDLVRLGIGAYGMWPSNETLVTAALEGRRDAVRLRPALTWKTRVAQVRDVPAGAYVSYGRTYRCTAESRLAVLPVGYYDGYDRRLSNVAHVLVRGQRAPVRGRVCMNMVVVDVTHVPGVAVGDEAVLLGRQQDEEIPAERLAGWIGTINYEVTTRINEAAPRVASPGPAAGLPRPSS